MRVKGRRAIVIPSSMAYGNNGLPNKVPANSHVIYQVDLVRLKPVVVEEPKQEVRQISISI